MNFPPLHPNCRCTTIAYDLDDNLEDLKAGELEYEEWYKKYVTDRKELNKIGSDKIEKFNLPSSDNSRYSKSPRINTSNTTTFTRTPNGIKPFEITAYHADGTNNNIFVSSNVKAFTKPKDIHELDTRFTDVYRLLNVQNSEGLPKICVASVDEIATNAVAAYNAIDNTLFINERIFRLPISDFACSNHKLSTILHECIHWKDAADYRAKFGEITKQNYYTEYLPYINNKCKNAIDKLTQNGYNINSTSGYACLCFNKGMFDEAYTEYRVFKFLGDD